MQTLGTVKAGIQTHIEMDSSPADPISDKISMPTVPCPNRKPGISATAIACGGYHTCVLVSGGAVKCWGWNDYGELGIGSTAQQNSPVDVGLGSGLAIIAPKQKGAGGVRGQGGGQGGVADWERH
jgi:hypothetical protein